MEAIFFVVISSFHIIKTCKRTLNKMQKELKFEKIKMETISDFFYFFSGYEEQLLPK